MEYRENIPNGNHISYNTVDIIKQDFVYFKEYFKKELRELKLKKLV